MLLLPLPTKKPLLCMSSAAVMSPDTECSRSRITGCLRKFLDGYNIINNQLKNTYQALTQGGDAELELIDSLDPFSEGITSFQIRYKYEIVPLSYIYLVYTKGGSIFENNIMRETSEIFKDPWNNPDNEIFSIKFRLKYYFINWGWHGPQSCCFSKICNGWA